MEAGLHLEHPMQCSVVRNEVEACGAVCAGCPACWNTLECGGPALGRDPAVPYVRFGKHASIGAYYADLGIEVDDAEASVERVHARIAEQQPDLVRYL